MRVDAEGNAPGAGRAGRIGGGGGGRGGRDGRADGGERRRRRATVEGREGRLLRHAGRPGFQIGPAAGWHQQMASYVADSNGPCSPPVSALSGCGDSGRRTLRRGLSIPPPDNQRHARVEEGT